MTTHTTLFHCLRYRDAVAAPGYLADGLGFERRAAHVSRDDPSRVDHAEMSWPGGGGIMFGSRRTAHGPVSRSHLSGSGRLRGQGLLVGVRDVPELVPDQGQDQQ